ncbi:PREDICTED: uncharacterized protein LOC105457447 isoform X2 [Wasmannia auropunctata]|uniref:uncharacterized protein LOC105457447 isoform X2 n=1 Tax=Wasmannia auropunctata TaxID=64793 RepID=UPI0005EF5F3F|nr:PREDICTED: uncharacterized protein LOC105457447 isoform X2 [Wasmannia auropunctata]
MSHSVTIRTQTVTSSSTIVINTGYLKTWSGILKLLQLEILYHSIAFGLLLAASLTLMVNVNNYRRYNYELLLGASICGLVNTVLYLFSTIIALRTYRGI